MTDAGLDMSGSYPLQRPIPLPVRRRRRRWPYVLLVLVLIIAAAAVVADRVAASVAQDKVAAKLAGRRPFSAAPSVRIHGFPFTTQALDGRYSDIEVSGPTQSLPTFGVVDLDAHLRGVHLTLSDVSKGVTSVPVDRADVRFDFALTTLAAQSGITGLTLKSDGSNGVIATAPLTVAGVGSITVTAKGRLSVSADGIHLATSDVSVLGQSIPVPGVAANALGFVLPLTGIPYNAQLDTVSVANDRVTMSGHATDIVLSQ